MSLPKVRSIEAWLALPGLQIAESEEGTSYDVTKVSQLAAKASLCHAAGIADPPLEQGGDRVVFPMVDVVLPAGEQLLRLPLDLGGWALDIVSLSQVAGVRLVPQRFRFRKYRGVHAAGAPQGDEYQVRSWLQCSKGSIFLPLTDAQLLDRLKRAGGDVMVGTWQDNRTGRFEAGLRVLGSGAVMALSAHEDRHAATIAVSELEARLDRLVRSRDVGLAVASPGTCQRA